MRESPRKEHVVEGVQRIEKAEILINPADVSAAPGVPSCGRQASYIESVPAHAPLIRQQDSADEAEKCRFPCSGRSFENSHISSFQGEFGNIEDTALLFPAPRLSCEIHTDTLKTQIPPPMAILRSCEIRRHAA